MPYLKIGDVARRFGLSPQTIRNYEAAGLIPPPVRTRTGLRLFRAEDLPLIEHVILDRRDSAR